MSTLLFCFSCNSNYTFYKKEFTADEKLKNAEQLLQGLGYYYQGTPAQTKILEEIEIHNNKHPELWRERGIPYLKRGIASGYYPNYEKCIQLDAVNWQGFRGYCTLYFYRDYNRALQDFNELDVLTPNFVDYPQSTSIDYMRAICYLKLGQHEQALAMIKKHMAYEQEQVGENYVHAINFIIEGQIYEARGQMQDAQKSYEKGIRIHQKNADLKYYLARLLLQKNQVKAQKLLKEAKADMQEGYSNSRPYVAEFFQVYLSDIDDLLI